MKELPILYSGSMIPPILVDIKTQTRRVITLPGWAEETSEDELFEMDGDPLWPYAIAKKTGCLTALSSPYGAPGDRLWVRENISVHDEGGIEYVAKPIQTGLAPPYIKSPEFTEEQMRWFENYGKSDKDKVIPSIHMPRWAARIFLDVVSVRVERVQDISAYDALCEGIDLPVAPGCEITEPPEEWKNWSKEKRDKWATQEARAIYFSRCMDAEDHIDAFKKLWDSINLKRGFGWDVNPWVWVVEFKRVS